MASAAFRVAITGTFWITFWKHVAADDRPALRAERARRLDVGLLADADHVVADDAEVLRACTRP